jgi:hypothetical protein
MNTAAKAVFNRSGNRISTSRNYDLNARLLLDVPLIAWRSAPPPVRCTAIASRIIDRPFSAYSSRATDDLRKGRRRPIRSETGWAAQHRRRRVVKLKLAVAALALVLATPTFAAEYYIVHSTGSKKCSVVSKKPTSDKATLVGDGTAYKSKKEARTALKAADVCKA